jgi:hypothetical protein
MMQWEEVDNTYIENFSGVHEREYRVTSVPRTGTTCTTLHPGSLLVL